MNKKLLSLVLALVMVLGTFTSAFAATTTTETTDEKLGENVETVEKIVGKDNKIQYIIDKKFVEGYENGDYGYDKEIKRSEITKLIVFANGNKELAEKLQGSMKLYNDVDTAYWANGVISVGTTVPSSANGLAMLNGYPDGSFKPEKNVTYAELAKMLVVLVKEDLTADMMREANAKWATQWMSWAAQLGILDDVTVANSDAPANRADAFTMLYNALYKMQEFKRVPANEKIGVLSKLSRSELTLNQDSEQKYTITDDTVFVNLYGKKEISNTIKVKDITNPDYYYGSLVRVMYNDKKEVTHILELGNPEEMALGRDIQSVGKNSRWKGVADSTVSTGFNDINTLKDNIDKVDKTLGYASIAFKSGNVDVKEIVFHNVKNNDGKLLDSYALKVNDDTKVYVANPANDQMKEVKDIYEALRLIGFKDNYEVVPNVYAGFDAKSSKTPAYNPEYSGNTETAKVVVFNVVSKEASATLYRVLESSSSLGSAIVENTDGEKFDKEHFTSVGQFPYNYGDKFDVIKVRNGINEAVTTVLDHSDTDEYPIVEVVKVDGQDIDVKGTGGRYARINISGADVFTKKLALKEGTIIQVKAEEKGNPKNEVSIVSIKPEGTGASTWDLAGNIDKHFVSSNDREVQSVGILDYGNIGGTKSITTKLTDDSLGNIDDYRNAEFKISDENYAKFFNATDANPIGLIPFLEEYEQEIRDAKLDNLTERTIHLQFAVNRNTDSNSDLYYTASKFEVKVNNKWVPLADAVKEIKSHFEDKNAVIALIEALPVEDEVEIADKADIEDAREAYDALKNKDGIDIDKLIKAEEELERQEVALEKVIAYEDLKAANAEQSELDQAQNKAKDLIELIKNETVKKAYSNRIDL